MMRPPRLSWLVPPTVLCLLALAAPDRVHAWTPAMERRMAEQSVQLMPPSLRGILTTHIGDLRRGLVEASAGEGGSGHMLEPGQTGDSLAGRLERLVDEVVGMIDGQRPFSQVARKMGELAHFAGDLNNPLNLSSADPLEPRYSEDYERYVESNLVRYPLVFNGWESELADPGDSPAPGLVAAFAEKTADRVRRYYEPVSRAYAPDNEEPLERRFGVRSLPFGIGSLSYSNSVSDIARLWLHAWKRAHGDIRGLPLSRPGPEALRPPGGKP